MFLQPHWAVDPNMAGPLAAESAVAASVPPEPALIFVEVLKDCGPLLGFRV